MQIQAVLLLHSLVVTHRKFSCRSVCQDPFSPVAYSQSHLYLELLDSTSECKSMAMPWYLCLYMLVSMVLCTEPELLFNSPKGGFSAVFSNITTKDVKLSFLSFENVHAGREMGSD